MKKNLIGILAGTVIIVAICAGILYYQKNNKQIVSNQFTKQKESQEVSIEKLISNIADKFIPENYDKINFSSFVTDLDKDGSKEIILGALPKEIKDNNDKFKAYLTVISYKENSYKEVANFIFNEETEVGFRGTPGIISKNDIVDIDNDGKKEMVLYLGSGGASNEAYGIFKIDWEAGKINWLKFQDKDKIIGYTWFAIGGTVMYGEDFELRDIDGGNDFVLDIIEKHGENMNPMGDTEDFQWTNTVYKWDGSMFVFEREYKDKGTAAN